MALSKFNADRIVGISAMIISLSSLIVFIYQTKLMREHQYQSVYPYLSVTTERFGFPNPAIILTNDGIGPAIIVSSVITYKGEKYETDLPSFLFDNYPEADSIANLVYTNIKAGQLIPAGQRLQIITIDETEDMESANLLFQVLQKLDKDDVGWDIIYRDIYDNKWALTGENEFPVKVK